MGFCYSRKDRKGYSRKDRKGYLRKGSQRFFTQRAQRFFTQRAQRFFTQRFAKVIYAKVRKGKRKDRKVNLPKTMLSCRPQWRHLLRAWFFLGGFLLLSVIEKTAVFRKLALRTFASNLSLRSLRETISEIFT